MCIAYWGLGFRVNYLCSHHFQAKKGSAPVNGLIYKGSTCFEVYGVHDSRLYLLRVAQGYWQRFMEVLEAG